MPGLPTSKAPVVVAMIGDDVAHVAHEAQQFIHDGADALLTSTDGQQEISAQLGQRVPVWTAIPDHLAHVAFLDRQDDLTSDEVTLGDLTSDEVTAVRASVALNKGATVLVTTRVAAARRVRDIFAHLQTDRTQTNEATV